MASLPSRRDVTVAGAVAVAVVLTALVFTRTDPLPRMGSAVSGLMTRVAALSTPEPAWTRPLDDDPTSASVLGHAVIFGTRTGVEVHDLGTGRLLWGRETRAAWLFRDALLAASCTDRKRCVLARLAPATGTALWSTPVTGPVPAGTHPSAAPVPSRVGIPTGAGVLVVDAESGRRAATVRRGRTASLSTTDRRGPVLAADGTAVVLRAGRSVTAVDPRTGRSWWTHPRPAGATVTLLPDAVVVAGHGRFAAYPRHRSAATLVAGTTSARVLGSAPTGLVLARGRTVGVLPFRPSKG